MFQDDVHFWECDIIRTFEGRQIWSRTDQEERRCGSELNTKESVTKRVQFHVVLLLSMISQLLSKPPWKNMRWPRLCCCSFVLSLSSTYRPFIINPNYSSLNLTIHPSVFRATPTPGELNPFSCIFSKHPILPYRI